MYNIADTRTKKRINTYIEEWQDKGLLTGDFGTQAKNIYKRTRVKNSEILELLIYGAYIEEQSKLDEYENQIMYEDANYYYQQGQEEVNKTLKKKKVVSVIPDAIFLSLMMMPNAKGYIWKDYIQAMVKYNADQIYRQATIDLQQQKELDITNDIYQNLIKRQQNSRLNINGDKISGDTDLTLIGINNKAKLEGVYSFDDKAEVQFVSIEDDKTTKMCKSLDGQKFKVHDWNEFERYSENNRRTTKYRCYGLIVGLNCPPIDDHFHWCRSFIMYVSPLEKQEKTEYNLDIPKISKEVKQVLGNIKLNNRVKRLFNKYLTNDNVTIDTNNNKAMYYSVDNDKIIINPNHKDFKKYDLSEALSHEIIHLIEKRNKLTDKINIESNIEKAQLKINLNSQKYINMFKDNRYADNMFLSDIFSSLTFDNIAGNIGHDYDYWYNIDNIKSELSANIVSAYLNNNTDTLKIIESISALKNIKEEVVKKYDRYTR